MDIQKVSQMSDMSWLPPFAAEILHILNKEQPQSTMLVGGCVRDAMLASNVTDIDIATKHHPEAVGALLKKRGIHVIPTGVDHGTVTAVEAHAEAPVSVEITTLRKDVETDGRRAVIAFTDQWYEDAQRRDFTINTLLCDAAGNIYDPIGNGYNDLKSRRVLFVGEAQARIAEDILRILRFFRFQSLFPENPPDSKALEACRQAADKINQLSVERVTHEILKILAADDAPRIFEMMDNNGILEALLSAKGRHQYLLELFESQKKVGDICISARIAALCGWDIDFAKKILLKTLRLSKAREEKLRIYLRCFHDLKAGMDIFEAAYRHSKRRASQSLLGQGRIKDYNALESYIVPTFPLTGQDFIDRGLEQGPRVGALLTEIKKWWIAQKFQPSREECLERLEQKISIRK